MRKRRTYWIADEITAKVRDRALLLTDKGFDVQFFTSLDAFTSELHRQRASIIIVSDDGDEVVTEHILLAITGLAEVQGAKLVMVRSKVPHQSPHGERLKFLAACANFRDIIPSDLDERLWLTRFIYATAGQSMQYVQPAGQITFNNISALSMPARVTWLGDRKVRLECRAHPPIGATLNLSGALAAACDVGHLSLKVVETQRNHLLYRFSDAIIAEWSVPEAARANVAAAISELRQLDPGPRCRVFVAVQSTALRAEIMALLADPRFDVNTALQKQSIAEEPKFFTPDVVFIEEALCVGEDAERFERMLTNLQPGTSVLVLAKAVGQKPDGSGKIGSVAELQKRHLGRLRIQYLVALPKTIAHSTLARILPQRAASGVESQDRAAQILADHPYSFAEISFPARLHRLHPLAAQIAVPFPVGTFALARLESPLVRRLLGRNPYVKLTSSYQDMHPDAAPFTQLADCYLADIDQQERRLLVTGLTKLCSDNFTRLDPHLPLSALRHKSGKQRTPELGSLRDAVDRPAGERAYASMGNAAVASAAHLAPPTSKPPLVIAPRFAESLPPPQIALVQRDTAADDEYFAARSHAKLGKRGVQTKPLNLRQLLIATALVGFIGVIIYALVTQLAGRVDRSGGVYSDQLKKFAPHLNDAPPAGQ